MTSPARDLAAVPGAYEQLVTERVAERLRALTEQGWHPEDQPVDSESSPRVLGRFIAEEATRVLAAMEPAERVAGANRILAHLADLGGAGGPAERVAAGPRELVALARPEAPGVYQVRPLTRLSDAALNTNAPDDVNLGAELRAELATADQVDLLSAFVKWHGVRVLQDALHAARQRGVRLRVITTTYLGATERRALDRLVREFGAEVKINYAVLSTRLHAKAWLFRRNSGFHTAYVGSSNLSRAALLDGLEWNVRLSSVATPEVLRKFQATFDAYWSDPSFVPYDPDRDGAALQQALQDAAGGGSSPSRTISLSGLDVRPHPHQQDMLERLEVERRLHDTHHNLLVAATGTGKTVMAALDYRSLRARHGRDLTLLFVAHRKEILRQSRRTYQEVLTDPGFGEELVDGQVPSRWKHVFAGVQALAGRSLEDFAPDAFDVIVIDEFHHAVAPTYRRIIDHFRPLELLGLTATPERMDGRTVQDEFFDGRIAAELRLWEALENELLSPFHYFGIADGTDLTAVTWRKGGYDAAELDRIYTGNDARARLIVKAVADKVADPGAMRALGFCVSVEHARFMAAAFDRAGLAARALSGQTPAEERRAALDALRSGALQVLFSVDLFNEGLDIPDVDTLLLLRPTASATVFLQQLGRGLRRSPNKAVLTVLDFIGVHRAEFRFEDRFTALTNLNRNRLAATIEQDFPRLPSGCQIVLDRTAKERVLAGVRSRLRVGAGRLAEEIAAYGQRRLAGYLHESNRAINELYAGRNSWTGLLRRAGLASGSAPDGEAELLRRAPALLHADDPERIEGYLRLLEDGAPPYRELPPREQTLARMLFFSLWPLGGGFSDYQQGFDALRRQEAFRDEARQILAYGLRHTEHLPTPLGGPHAGIPLTVHASYSREEILPALGQAGLGSFLPGHFQEGVRWCPQIGTDALLITIDKDEKDFSPQTRYRDFAMGRDLFHWETQNRTSASSPTGQRYRDHRSRGTHVLLFVRRYKKTDIGGPQPWMLLGPARYVSHQGSSPMGIVWQLDHPLPADVWAYCSIAAG